MKLKVDKLKGSDLKKCIPLFIKEHSKNPYDEHWNSKQAFNRLKRIYKGNKNYCFAAKVDNKIIGFILGRDYQWSDGKRVFVEEIIVDERIQGKGVGTLLWNAFENRLKSKGIKLVQVIVHPKAKAYGFPKKIGLRKSDYELVEMKVRKWL